jgi:hypothetical protein
MIDPMLQAARDAASMCPDTFGGICCGGPLNAKRLTWNEPAFDTVLNEHERFGKWGGVYHYKNGVWIWKKNVR